MLINIKSLIEINQTSNFVKVLTKKRNDKNGVHKSQRFEKKSRHFCHWQFDEFFKIVYL